MCVVCVCWRPANASIEMRAPRCRANSDSDPDRLKRIQWYELWRTEYQFTFAKCTVQKSKNAHTLTHSLTHHACKAQKCRMCNMASALPRIAYPVRLYGGRARSRESRPKRRRFSLFRRFANCALWREKTSIQMRVSCFQCSSFFLRNSNYTKSNKTPHALCSSANNNKYNIISFWRCVERAFVHFYFYYSPTTIAISIVHGEQANWRYLCDGVW